MTRGYPNDWNRRRKVVYKRDNYTCQNCGRQGGPYGNIELHAHHIVPKSKGGTHGISNLKTLCEGCHNAIHGGQNAPTARKRRIDNQSSSNYGGNSSSNRDSTDSENNIAPATVWFVFYPMVTSMLGIIFAGFSEMSIVTIFNETVIVIWAALWIGSSFGVQVYFQERKKQSRSSE